MERCKAYIWIGLSYCIALIVAYIVWYFISSKVSLIWTLLIADIAATIVIWIFGLVFKNSSFYDPYWSLIPWGIILFLMIEKQLFSTTNIILFLVLTIWSWRLTINWAYTCTDIKTQDWRYTKFKQENKAVMWHIINFFGIHLLPTFFVYAGLIPAIFLITKNANFQPLILIGATIVLIGSLLEFFADYQMHQFRKKCQTGEVLQNGLWKYSRHPNYLGEINIWLGVYVMMVVVLPQYWYLVLGTISMIFLFTCISIPMMEKRQIKRRSMYEKYQRKTSMLLLLPNKKVKE